MQFQKSLLAAAGLLTLAMANPAPEPQSPAQTSALESALESYYVAMATNSAFLSVVEQLATDDAAVATLSAFQSSIQSLAAAHKTPAPDFLKGLPTQAQSLFGSIYTAELSIASENGFTSKVGSASAAATGSSASGAPAPQSTSSGSDAAATGKAVGVAAAGLAGLMGVVMAL